FTKPAASLDVARSLGTATAIVSAPNSLGDHGCDGRKRSAEINKLNKEINAALADPKIKARLADMGATVLACWLARGLQQVHRRRNRELGQGDPGGQTSSRSDYAPTRPSINTCPAS